MVVHDVSGREDEYTLDRYGFQFCRNESKEKDFANDATIRAIYYPEVDQLLKYT